MNFSRMTPGRGSATSSPISRLRIAIATSKINSACHTQISGRTLGSRPQLIAIPITRNRAAVMEKRIPSSAMGLPHQLVVGFTW